MSSRPTLVAFIYLAIMVLALTVSASQRDLIIGNKGENDVLVHQETVKKASSQMKVLIIEKTFNTDNGQTISQVKALDQNQDGKGATASVRQGGPGHTSVTLSFKSQRGQGIDFVVELYGNN